MHLYLYATISVSTASGVESSSRKRAHSRTWNVVDLQTTWSLNKARGKPHNQYAIRYVTNDSSLSDDVPRKQHNFALACFPTKLYSIHISNSAHCLRHFFGIGNCFWLSYYFCHFQMIRCNWWLYIQIDNLEIIHTSSLATASLIIQFSILIGHSLFALICRESVCLAVSCLYFIGRKSLRFVASFCRLVWSFWAV